MREMKDSGVQWVGSIPSAWTVFKLKHIIRANDGGIWGDDPVDGNDNKCVIRSTEQTVDGQWNITEPAKRDLRNVNYSKSRILPGDLLITKSSGSALHIGKTTIADAFFADNECYYSNFLQRIRVEGNAKYVWYILNSQLSRDQFVYIQNSTSGIGNINSENIANIYLPNPSEKDKQQIVDYLDRRCATIDTLIANQQQQIEKLKQYKQAVITEAVTRGLDPNVQMKDSGVEWIGQVPEHWEIHRIAYLYEERKEPGADDLPLLQVSINTGVSDHEMAEDEQDRVFIRMEDKTKYKRVYPGDLTYNMMRAWQGAFGAVRVNGMVSPAYVVAKPRGNASIDTRYFEALLRTHSATEEMHRYSHGIMDFRLRLYWPEFRNIRVCLPPYEEQQRIAAFIDEKSAQIDALIAVKQQKADKLAQYKKSLIYEVVTGKREVLA